MKNINEDHFCSDGCTGSGEARVQQRKRRIQRRVQQKQKDQEDEVFGRILSAKKMKTVEGLKTAGYKVSTAGEKVNAVSTRPAYNLLKGTCKSYVELDYTMEECYRALSEQLDWNNPEGHRCPYDLTKPLLVQISSQGRKIVLADFFFNNKLEYLRGGSNDKKYTTFTTNSKSERMDISDMRRMSLSVVEKKTVVPTIPKVDVVRPKQQEKPVRKTVRYAEMYRSQKPRGNQRNWNNQKSQQLGSDFVMNNKACFVCGSFDHLKKDYGKRIIKPVWKNTRRVNDHYSTRMTHSNPRRNMIPQAVLMRSGIKAVNTAKPKDAHNAVKRNRMNNWEDMKNINEDHFCSDGCTGSGEARVQQRKRRIQRRVQQKQKDQEDEVFGRILSAKKMKEINPRN
ncbi:hypothetical protein Tco_1080141 [Tanacetum coccineum]|uniref:Uncharacterized protein n=1 Tax=Tanacetum coccineum TaxID=301880 RepID=A0ABQ5HTT9_9ASTR